jgi:mitochondrial FAD-linked sulfhydryl oxidase
MDEFKKEVKEICRACIDVKSWFKETGKPIMKSSASIAAALLYSDPIVENPTVHKLSSSNLLCPPDAKELGRGTWTFLHTTAAYLPEKPSEEQKKHVSNLFKALSQLYPCRHCAEHLTAYMEVNPIALESKKSISTWLCNFHNEVNEMLGKERFDCSKIDERWKNGPNDDSCS